MKNDKAFKYLDLFGELFVLNIVFLVFSIPIVTIGASWSALYSTVFKLIEGKEGNVFNTFFVAFKKNFKQSMIVSALFALYAVVLFAQYYLILSFSGMIRYIYITGIFITLALGCLVIPFIFPIISRYDNKIGRIIKNSIMLSISHLGACIKILCLLFAPMTISIIYPKVFLFTWFLWFTILPALIVYVSSKIIFKVFEEIEK